MSDKSSNQQGHWESHSASSQSVKIGNNPATVTGHEASASGTFDHGKPVVQDSHSTSFTNEGHPGRLEFHDDSGKQQKSIK